MKISHVIVLVITLCIVVVASLVVPFAKSSGVQPSSKRLILFQGTVLSAYYDDRYVEVKRLDPARGMFYGYGWIGDGKVFVAYQDENEITAIANIEIVDLVDASRTKLANVGGVGESLFDVSDQNGDVVYSTETEIRIMRFNPEENSYSTSILKQGVFCWGAFWVDAKTVGCNLMDNGGSKFVKYDVKSQ